MASSSGAAVASLPLSTTGPDQEYIKALQTLVRDVALDPSSASTFDHTLDKTRSLSQAAEAIKARSSSLTPGFIGRLDLLVSICTRLTSDISIASTVLKDQSVKTVQDVATKFYCRDPPHDVSPGDWNAFRAQLFAQEPTAVLYALIVASQIPVPKNHKDEVDQTFSAALSAGFDITKTNIVKSLENRKGFQSMPDDKKKGVTDFLKRLQRLQALVVSPSDLASLMKTPYASAHQIAHTPIKRFLDYTSKAGLDKSAATRIHDHAASVEARNEQAWIRLIQARSAVKVAAIDGPEVQARTAAKSPARKRALARSAAVNSASSAAVSGAASSASSAPSRNQPAISFVSLFGDISEPSCADCDSVTSPAAYLVDLLQMLKNSSANPSDPKSPNLQDKLYERRHDLDGLALSCANTNTLIPYIDLVNEIMESFVAFLGSSPSPPPSPPTLPIYDTHDSDTSAVQIAEPQNIRYDIYDTYVSKQFCPLDTFPYNQAVDCFRSYLTALGSSRLDVLNNFQSPYRAAYQLGLDTPAPNPPTTNPPAPNPPTTNPPTTNPPASNPPTTNPPATNPPATNPPTQDVLDQLNKLIQRTSNAEQLGLLEADYNAIAKESLWPIELVKQLLGKPSITTSDYGNQIGLLTPAQYWGFGDGPSGDADMRAQLALVKEQLLPRSGLAFKDLVKILQTQFLRPSSMMLVLHSLGVVDAHGAPEVSSSLDDITLAHSDGSGLTTDDCDRLGCFIRLWYKLGWSIDELDEALIVLGQTSADSPVVSVTGDTIDKLASLQQIVALTQIEVIKLLPLWGNIGPTLQKQLFLSRRVKQNTTKLALDPTSKSLPPVLSIPASSLPAVLAALRLSPQDHQTISTAAKLSGDLNLSDLSALYRLSVLPRILEITPSQYSLLSALFPGQTNPLLNPPATLAFLQWWNTFNNAGWTLQQLLYVLKISPSPDTTYSPSGDIILQATASLVPGIKDIDNNYAEYTVTPFPRDKATADLVQKISTVMFDAATVTLISQFLEGSLQVSATAQFQKTLPDISILPELNGKVVYQTFSVALKGVLTLTGILSQTEFNNLKALSTDPQWVSAVNALDYSSKYAYLEILAPYFPAGDAAQNLFFFGQVPQSGSPPTQADSADEIKTTKRAFYLEYMILAVMAQLKQQLVLKTIQQGFPDTDGRVPQLLLTSADINNLSTLDSTVTSGTGFQGYLIADSTDTYQFVVSNPSANTFDFNNVSLTFSHGTPQGQVSNNLTLNKDQAYQVSFPQDVNDVQLRTLRTAPVPLSAYMFVSEQALQSKVRVVFENISRATTVINAFNLSIDEIQFFQTSRNVDFGNLTFADLQGIQTYSSLRDSINVGAPTPLSRLFILAPLATNQTDLARAIAQGTSWSQDLIANLLKARYLGMPDLTVAALFKDGTELAKLNGAVNAYTALNLTKATMEQLHGFADPLPLNETSRQYSDAASFRLLLPSPTDSTWSTALTSANDSQRKSRRQALVQYLLRQQYIQGRGATDADGLFEFLLIDVQMGACLQTSRIKQAISTVQLFVKRCLLNLEVNNHIFSDSIDQTRWSWMQKDTLWVNNRNIFLYPENWLDPSLRDDKSEAFLALEAAVLQNGLSEDAIDQLVRTYIYSAHDVSDLNVLAYLWVKQGGFQGTFHVFASTKTKPMRFYYRYMTMLSPTNAGPYPVWYPWTKLDLQIPSIELDAEGNSLATPGSYLVPAFFNQRLYLFMPQFTLKKVQTTNSITVANLANGTVSDTRPSSYWEIKMAWSELRNGKWSAKQTSHAALNAPDPLTDPSNYGPVAVGTTTVPAKKGIAPDPTTFRFWIRTRTVASNPDQAILVIDVEQSTDPSASDFVPMAVDVTNWYYGSFEMRGSQVFVASPPDVPPPTSNRVKATLMTSFGKLIMGPSLSSAVPPGNIPKGGAGGFTPLLTRPLSDSKRSLTWTLSFDYDSFFGRATGFITEADYGDALGSQTFFGMPPFRPPIGLEYPPLVINYFYHAISPSLMIPAANGDLDGIFDVLSNKVQSGMLPEVFGRFNGPYNELSTPFALYNWELGVHMVSLLMEKLLASQQYDLAIRVANLVFDPKILDFRQCWKFPPFRDDSVRLTGSIDSVLNSFGPNGSADASMTRAVAEWKRNPFLAHSVARGRPVAYMKRIVITYIKILIAYGDSYFRQNSLEAVPSAIQLYVEASHVFGPAPEQIPQLGKRQVKSYRDLAVDLDAFSETVIDMELEFPFISDPSSRGSTTGSSGSSNLLGFVATRYFCVPFNPDIIALRSQIDDRLYKIRNCLDINGNPIRLSLWDPPIGSKLLTSPSGVLLNASAILNDMNSPLPNYRFVNLLQKAFELCSELKQFGEAFIGNKDKLDAESMAALRARQDTKIQTLLLDMKKLQRDESKKAVESLQESRRAPVDRLTYYTALTGDNVDIPDADTDFQEIPQVIDTPTADDLRMSTNEALELQKADSASTTNQQAALLETEASYLFALPKLFENIEPLGAGISTELDFSNLAQYIMTLASVLKMFAQNDTDQSISASRKAQLIRQLQDRRLQANLAGRDIKSIDKQIEVEKVRLAIANADIKQQQKQIANAKEIERFLKTKYTNVQLYTWMDNSLRTLFYQTYLLTSDLARKAEMAFQFERGIDTSYISPTGYWDSGRDGLFCAESLNLDLRRLEAAYQESRGYDFEIVKYYSLRQARPMALLTLKETGSATFDIPEVRYDFDFPGHYNRRIKSVTVTIPCVVGPYTSVNCTLSLTSNQYRATASATDYPGSNSNTSGFRTENVPITSIAVSSAMQDSGCFELNFHDERYMPFEGAGAISQWTISLPDPALAQFDYNTISDVILQVRYTSSKGPPKFQTAVTTYLKSFLSAVQQISSDEGLWAFFDLKHDFAGAWYQFAVATPDPPPTLRTMTLRNLSDRLPFYTRGKTITATSVWLLAATDPKGISLDATKITITTTGAVARVDMKSVDSSVYPGVGSIGGLTVFVNESNQQPTLGPWTINVDTGGVPQPTSGGTAPATGGGTAPATGGGTAPATGGGTVPATGGGTAPATGTQPSGVAKPAVVSRAPATGTQPSGGTPAPAGGDTLAPAGEGTPAPAGGGTPAPTGGGTPAPAGGGTPAPTGGGTPAPTGGGTPAPSGGSQPSGNPGVTPQSVMLERMLLVIRYKIT